MFHPFGQLPRSQEPGIGLQLAGLPAAPAGFVWACSPACPQALAAVGPWGPELSPLAPTNYPPFWPLGCWLGRATGRGEGIALTQVPEDLQVCPRIHSTRRRETQASKPDIDFEQFEGKNLFRAISRHLRTQGEITPPPLLALLCIHAKPQTAWTQVAQRLSAASL